MHGANTKKKIIREVSEVFLWYPFFLNGQHIKQLNPPYNATILSRTASVLGLLDPKDVTIRPGNSATIHQPIRHHRPQDFNLQQLLCMNL